jgi:hypothetical protein
MKTDNKSVPILSPFLPSLAFAAFLLCGCRLSKEPEAPPLPLSQRVTWLGMPAVSYADSLPPSPDSGQNALELPAGVHEFGFSGPDSARLRLSEYREAYWAYAAFQRSAKPFELADGFYREGDVWFFLHDRFVGELRTAGGVLAAFPKENLAIQGETLPANPKEFEAFPLLGKIPHSERVIPRHFLGRSWRGPVFTVSYRCHGDTATAFRAFAQNFQEASGWMRDWEGKPDTLNWGREIHFQGWDEFRRPLIFWIFSEGVMGFTGCFDRNLAQEYAEKMEKTAIFWPKP